MPQVRYLGFTVGEASFDSARGDGEARFLTFTEPLPVGTVIEVDGVRQRVSRIEEGQNPGFWVLPEGSQRLAQPAAPEKVEAEETAPSPPPIEMTAEPEEPEDGAPEAIAEATPETVNDEPGGGNKGKRKRRNRKTVLGR